LQKKISVNAAQCLEDGGLFIYITCSVFAAENEEAVEYIQSNTKLRSVASHYLKGYDTKGDTLFVAVFN
jgi:16S rRNA (cytosine967-C5)-methyltransferase